MRFARITPGRMVWIGLVVLVAAGWAGSSAALAQGQTTPALTATATGNSAVWRIQGTGFTPGTQLRVLEIPCGQLPCGADTTAFATATAGTDGRFSADLNFTGLTPRTGRTTFLVSAFPITRAGEATDPTVEVPGSAGRAAPLPPATGQGLQPASPSAIPQLFAAVLLGLVAAAARLVWGKR